MNMIIINGENYTKDSKISFEDSAICNLTIEKIAKAIADKPSDLQGIFFNEFAKSVNTVCKEHTGLKGELQFMYVANDLSDEAIEMIRAMLYKIDEDKKEQDK